MNWKLIFKLVPSPLWIAIGILSWIGYESTMSRFIVGFGCIFLGLLMALDDYIAYRRKLDKLRKEHQQ